MKKVVPLLIAVGLVLFYIIGRLGYTAYVKYAPSKELSDLSDYYQVSGDEIAVYLDGESQDEKGLLRQNQPYLPLTWVNQKLNERFYWDEQEKILVYTLPESIVYMNADSRGDDGLPLFLEDADGIYLSKDLILTYTDIRVTSFLEDEIHRLFISTCWEPETWNVLKRKGAVREKGGIKSPIVALQQEGAKVRVLDSMDYWARVQTEDGHMGYIEKLRLGDGEPLTFISTFQAPVYKNISLNQKICLAWHQVTSPEGNASIQKVLRNTKGINVISPTWFSMADNEGNYTSLADRAYVDYLHDQGIQVWALIDNFSSNVQSEVLFSRTSVRTKLISSLMQDVQTYNLDGLNLDFESLKESAGPHYIQFIRELSVACRKNQVILSIDNHVPAPYNAFYNRKERGNVADYIIIMGYDEHYAGGEAGPVASLPYVKNGIKDTLKEVPKEKVINAVPFYTRVWKTNKEGNSSDALGISDAKAWVKSNRVALQWKEDVGAYYGEVITEDESKIVWMEEERSLGLKMEQIKSYDLAGVACWKLGFEPKEIWDVVKAWEEVSEEE